MAVRFDLQPHTRRRPDWGRALRDARALVDDGDRTELAFRIQWAVDPDLNAQTLHAMLRHPEGRRLFRTRLSLREALDDRERLQRLPEGSLGRAYQTHLDRHGLSPTKLVALGEAQDDPPSKVDTDLHWWVERSRLSHDLWHVVSGYSATREGEAALLWFSFGQIGGHSNWILGSLAALHLSVDEHRFAPIGRGFRAWRRGRDAACLGALPWEHLLEQPLDEVRRAAGIAPLATADRV